MLEGAWRNFLGMVANYEPTARREPSRDRKTTWRDTKHTSRDSSSCGAVAPFLKKQSGFEPAIVADFMQRLWSVGVLALVFALIGCGSDSPPVAPPTVDILTKESGDNQQILPDQTTMSPLVVAVTSAKGDPVPGVKVN